MYVNFKEVCQGCTVIVSVFNSQIAKQQEEEQKAKELMEKRAQFIEKNKNLLIAPEIVEEKPRGGGGKRGRVSKT